MTLDATRFVLPLMDFTRANPLTPEQGTEHPALKVGLGLGFAGFWLVALMVVLFGLMFLPRLFRKTGEPAPR